MNREVKKALKLLHKHLDELERKNQITIFDEQLHGNHLRELEHHLNLVSKPSKRHS